MVGSVLMERMQAERDFAHFEPVFFTTSQRRRSGAEDRRGREGGKLLDAKSVDALEGMDVIVTCQGGDYTNEIYPQLRVGRLERLLDRRGLGAADEGRRGHHSRSGQSARHQGRAQPRASRTTSAAIARSA